MMGISSSKYSKGIVSALVAGGIALSAAKSATAEHDRAWRISDVKGSASVSTDGRNWTALKRGDTVSPGASVKTGENGRLILVRPGDSLDVAPGSQFNIPSKPQTKGGNPATHIAQKLGTILFKITTRPDKPFTVKTPYLAAVIKGTTFTVSVDRNDAALHVSKGAVQVSSILGGQTALVRPGQTAAVSANGGGRMRLIGFKNQGTQPSTGGSAQGNGKAQGAANEGAANGGRGQVAKSVIPRAIGQKRLNIEKVSRGLVNDGSANRGGPARSGGGKGNNKLSAAPKTLKSFSSPAKAPVSYGNNGISGGNGFGGGNGVGNANGGGNNGGGNNGGGNNGGGNNGGGNNGGGNNGGGNNGGGNNGGGNNGGGNGNGNSNGNN